RLESYDLLIRGTGEDGVFSYVDHQWVLPGLLRLSIATAAGAIPVLLSGWTGQLRTSFIAVTVIVVLAVGTQELIPWMVGRFTPRETQIIRERPYAATRADFTRRAYASNAAAYEAMRKSGVSAARDSVVSSAASRQLLRLDSLAYPGGRGLVLLSDLQLDVDG